MKALSLSSYFRVCALCSAYSLKTDLYCLSCWGKLNQLKLPYDINSINSYDFKLTCLWNWNLNNSQAIRNLIYCLKQGKLDSAYLRIARDLAYKARLNLRSLPKEQICLIPAPPRNPKESRGDHAYQLALSLSLCTGIELLPILKRTNSSSQKRRSRRHRQEINFEKISALPSQYQQIIFIDDLVTTGSTVRAAHRALGKQGLFSCWAIAEKKLEEASVENDLR